MSPTKRTAKIRSPFPSPPTCPSGTRPPSRTASVRTALSGSRASGASHHAGRSVVATRSTPSCSERAHWFSR
jgi:hypothetical protein